MQNFPQQLQTPLSQQRKAFFQFSTAIPKSTSNLKDLEKEDESSSITVFEISHSERGDYLIL